MNLDPSESDTAPISEEVLLGLKIPREEIQAGSAGGDRSDFRASLEDQEIETGQKFWRWAVLAALALFAMETLLSAWTSRRAAQPA